jgi:hypothetical protein
MDLISIHANPDLDWCKRIKPQWLRVVIPFSLVFPREHRTC